MKKLFEAVTVACLATILVSISAQTPSPSPNTSGEEGIADENAESTERCDCPSSPDGKFAFLVSDIGENSSGERLQILDLIEKKSGKKLQRIDDAAMPVLWNVVWAPNSGGFALSSKVVGHPRLEGMVEEAKPSKRSNYSPKIKLQKRSCGHRIQNALPSIT